MRDPVDRFTGRVELYEKYRPAYPSTILDVLKERGGLDRADVIAGRELRHHAAVRGVERDLGCDRLGQELRPPPHDGGGELIAGGFDAQDEHGSAT